MTVSRDIVNAYRFHRAHGGGIVGESALWALRAARAETLLETAVGLGVADVRWEYDQDPYDHGDDDAETVARLFDSGQWTGPFGCVVTVGRDPYDSAASLWGIVLGPDEIRDPYARVVTADLALEIEDDLRQAVGDARDRADDIGD